MKKTLVFLVILLTAINIGCFSQTSKSKKGYVRVEGQNLIMPDGNQLHIKGINLGNWLNPEGYLLRFKGSADSYRTIDEALKEMIGEAVTNDFWRNFQQYYITREDIRYIRKTGMNTIRVPFHYKMLTDEPYMGYASKKQGYALLDSLIEWCKEEGLYVILDMHDAPGGQTGINIDDSYGYPWLLVTEQHKQQFCEIWKEIAKRYAKNKTVLAYDLLNEPIASSFFPQDTAMLNIELEALLRRGVKTVREEDKNHIVVLSGSKWGNDYSIFKDWKYDNKLMFTCHRYHCDTTEVGISDFLAYREKFNLPFWMGETGHEPDQWIAGFNRMLDRVNIGWTYWPYKKMGNATSMMNIKEPKDWKVILDYINSDRSTLKLIRENRPQQEVVKTALNELILNMKFKNCLVNEGYIKALGMKP